jgi:hypothetical protein
MASNNIALSTSDKMYDVMVAPNPKGYINCNPTNLVYTTTKTWPTLVILAGCQDSFVPVTFYNSISSVFQTAYLSAFYTKDINTIWNQDYISKIFKDMGTGMTFSQAESDAWTTYLPCVWWPKHQTDWTGKPIPLNPLNEALYNIRELSTNGNTGFKL